MSMFADPEQFLQKRTIQVDDPIVHLFFAEGIVVEAFS